MHIGRRIAPAVLALTAILALASGAAQGAAGGAATYGTMYGQSIPTPLLLPPGLHARFVAEPVHTSRLSGGLVADGAVWTVTSGYPATLEAVSTAGTVTLSAPLPGAYGANAFAAGPDGSVWVGTSPTGAVYRYASGAKAPTLVARLPGVNTVWSLAYNPADGKIWAGTYPDGIWTIDPVTGHASRVATLPGVAGAHALGVADGQVWAGTYPSLGAIPLVGSVLKNLLPAKYSGSGQVTAIGPWSGGTAVLLQSGNLVWLGHLGLLGAGQVGVLSDVESLPTAFDGRTVLLRDGGLWTVHLSGPRVMGSRIAQLPSPLDVTATGVLGGRFAVLTPGGVVYLVSATGRVTTLDPSLGAAAGTIQTLAATPSALWGSAYLGGQVFQVTGAGAVTPLPGLDQVDSVAACGGRVYMGVYPSAHLYVDNPAGAWSPGVNPRLVGSPGDPQDRVPGIACLGDVAYIGTVPGGTHLGGVIYTSTGRTLTPPVPDQTPLSLAAWNGDLVGSLSDENALGTPAPTAPAHLFAYTPGTGAWKTVALPGDATFAGVLGTTAGVFAASPTQIARWNPDTGALSVRTFRKSGSGDTGWGMGTHLFQAGGRLYLVDDGGVYEVNPTTLAATYLFYGVEQVAVYGPSVWMSFYDGRWLIQIPTADLTPQASTFPHQFWYIWRHDGHVWPAPAGAKT